MYYNEKFAWFNNLTDIPIVCTLILMIISGKLVTYCIIKFMNILNQMVCVCKICETSVKFHWVNTKISTDICIWMKMNHIQVCKPTIFFLSIYLYINKY